MTNFERGFSPAASQMLKQFGETILYKPANGGMTRPITAIVTRRPPQQIENQQIGPSYLIECSTDPALPIYGGIDSRELDRGGDRITIAEFPGRPVDKVLSISYVPESEDFGMLRLECG